MKTSPFAGPVQTEIRAFHEIQVQEIKDEQSRTFKKYAFNIEIPADSDREILITAKSKKQRDYLNRALIYYEKAIKNYIRKCEDTADQ